MVRSGRRLGKRVGVRHWGGHGECFGMKGQGPKQVLPMLVQTHKALRAGHPEFSLLCVKVKTLLKKRYPQVQHISGDSLERIDPTQPHPR